MRTAPKIPFHLLGWLALALVMFLHPPGETAADTKLDLVADPAGFLAQATSAWTDTFTLGQLQNQAYGYLFPQGLFFLLADPLPDWIAQRLWWTIVTGVGFSGFLLLADRIQVGSRGMRIVAALLYALSPRALTTLTAISSETWPVMLAPWVLVPFLSARLNWRDAALAVVPVTMMGAVNATATLAACLPAGIVLLWRLARPGESSRGQVLRVGGLWLLGAAAVSFWWIVPLLILGAYSAPFTDYIENSFVTTRWLNLAEILRGTTSWAPFVETERVAGNLLVSEPVFVLITMAVAALGMVGLATKLAPLRELWVIMALVGIAILGAALGPLGEGWRELLDGPLAAFRNLHKFDPLVRIPLLIGLAALGSRVRLPRTAVQWRAPGKRHVAAGLVLLVAAASLAPAWSGRLLPKGTWEEVPDYWVQAADFLNEHAEGTRTLIAPEASFARQDWGWTRDEPAQPLLEVPWAVRDAVPLVPPEAIRGLDGVMTMLHHDPEAATDALRRLGIGAVLLRHDLDRSPDAGGAAGAPITAAELGVDDSQIHTFGAEDQIEVVMLDPEANLAVTDEEPVRVAGGGEILALLDTLAGPGPRELVAGDAQVVTDTPMLTARNFGTLDSPVSAPLADESEGDDIQNRSIDYPSEGPLTRVVEHGGEVDASSSASDASSFGGADPARSVTAAVDGRDDTAWWPTPGAPAGEWLEVHSDFEDQATVSLTATEDTSVTVSTGPAGQSPGTTVELAAGEPEEVVVPGPASGTIRVTLTEQEPVGISELAVEGQPIERVVTVPDTSPDVRQFVFQQLMVDTGVIIRDFTAPRDMTLELDAEEPVLIDGTEYAPGDTVQLNAGTHRLETEAEWVTLTEEGFDSSPAFSDTDETLAASDEERLLLTGRAANPGLRAEIDGTQLEPRAVDAATQAFVIPAGVSGTVEFSFAANGAYRASLVVGGVLAALVTLAAAVAGWRRRDPAVLSVGAPGIGVAVLAAVVLWLVLGWVGLAAGVVVAAVRRFTLIPAPALTGVLMAIAGAWLARAPWPTSAYAGDELVLSAVCAAAVACLVPSLRIARRAGSSTKE